MTAPLNYIAKTAFNAVEGIFIIPVFTLIRTAKTIGGVAATAFSIVTLGKFSAINKFANWTADAYKILPIIFSYTERVVNCNLKNINLRYPTTTSGCFTKMLVKPIHEKASKLTYNEYFLIREVGSRGCYALGGLVAVITRTADLALGLLAATFAIVPCLARVKMVSQFAVDQLTSLALVDDLCIGLRGIVNPHQFRHEF